MEESQNTEWKESWRDDYLKWICGFANADGGVIHVGRDDGGKVIGVPDANRLLEEIPNKVRDILGILVDVNLRSEDGLDYLEIVTEPHPFPVSCRGRYYYRSGSTKQELKGAALDRFLLSKQGRHWDGVPVPEVTSANLSDSAFDVFRELAGKTGRLEAGDLEEKNSVLIEKLHLEDGEYLKRAAVLLFHPDPERFVSGASIKIGFFDEDDELRYQDEVQGELFAQIAVALERLQTKYLKGNIHYVGSQRIEQPQVPEEALREALLNAVAHKDYASGTPIQIRVSDEELSIWNPGRLPENWTVDRLLEKHSSRPFNPDIANVLFRAGLIESWGQGIDRMRRACREAGTPEPGLLVEEDGFRVDFALPGVKTREKAREKPRVKTGEKSKEKTAAQILSLVRKKPEITASELAEQLGITAKGVEWQIRKLKQEGRLRRVGPARGGHWEVIENE